MRTPRIEGPPTSDRLRILALDVTDANSIAAAIEVVGPIDVLVNNAGIGVVGAFGVGVKLVEPGYGPTTSFGENTDIPVADLIPAAYVNFAEPIFVGFANLGLTTSDSDVAEVVRQAANDTSDRLHDPAGLDAVALSNAA